VPRTFPRINEESTEKNKKETGTRDKKCALKNKQEFNARTRKLQTNPLAQVSDSTPNPSKQRPSPHTDNQNISMPTTTAANAAAIAETPPLANTRVAALSTFALHQVATAAKPLHIWVH
jgi:hypothetical protein